jgi:ferritin-like metal-binding protein YciE
LLFSQDIKNMDDLFMHCATLLQQNLDEEKAADKKLTAMAESKINRKAA